MIKTGISPNTLRSYLQEYQRGGIDALKQLNFKKSITDCLNQTATTHKQELDSLLTLRFQSFKKD